MSFPNIPDVNSSIKITLAENINLLLASIAFEELGLSHIINSEAEKIQYILGTLPGHTPPVQATIDDLIKIDKAVQRVMRDVIKKEMLLGFKIEDIMNLTTSTSSTTSSSTTSTSSSTTSTSSSTTSTSSSTTSTSSSTTSTSSSTTSTSSSTTSTSSTTTSSTSTSSTTTTLQNIATATAEAIGTAAGVVTSSDDAFINYSTNPNITGKNLVTASGSQGTPSNVTLDGVNLGQLPYYLLFFSDGSVDANWQGATKGFVGNVAVNGLIASLRTSGSVPYAGTLYTNAATQGAWQAILDQNPTQATGVTGDTARITGLTANLVSAFQQINALAATPGFTSIDSSALDGLNTQNGINETFVINVTSGFTVSSKLNVTGDAGDIYILRWDTDADPSNGYQGQVKFQSGGAIVPHGGLTPTNFINVAGDIGSSGGGTNPLPPYPQGPRFNNGQGNLIIGGDDFNGGGFFTGYWLTTGDPTLFNPTTGLYYGETSSLSNAIFVGGWYTITTKFSMTSGTSGVYVSPNTPSIDVVKEVSVNNGATWLMEHTSPGAALPSGVKPWYRYTVTNTGPVTLTNVTVTDNIYGTIGTLSTLAPGASFQWVYQTV